MEFGIFDHVDCNDLPLAAYYEARLKLAEAYDRAGFYGYHVAEHHATPLGMAPSPSVFLAAVAQRTKRLRFGPMVYALPLYHPLRLIEEICMLDQMSNGRLDIGFGRGASPIELAYFGEDPAQSQAVYAEALEVIRVGLTRKSLTHDGKRFHFDDVPMELEPKQKPHPPIWYGLHAPESGIRAAQQALQVICLDPHESSRAAIDSFKDSWRKYQGGTALPRIGLGRFVVVGETDEAAKRIARRAYPRWHDSFTWLFRQHSKDRTISHPRPPDWDTLERVGQGMAGSPETVIRFLKEQHALTGATYCVGQFAFGDLTLEETLASVDRFVRKVMPALEES